MRDKMVGGLKALPALTMLAAFAPHLLSRAVQFR